MPNQYNVSASNVTQGAGAVLYSPRDTTPITVTALASPAPSTTSFAVSSADAAKLHKGDRIGLASATPTYLAPELATSAVITNISTDANPVITCTALSGAPPTTAGGVRVLWHNLGATDGGVRLEAAKEQQDVFVDQETAPVATVDQVTDVMIMAPLAEATLKNFALAMGHADPSSTSVLQISSADASRTDRWAFIGPAGGGLQAYCVVPKGKSRGRGVWNASKTDKPIFELEVKALVDSTSTPDLLDIKVA